MHLFLPIFAICLLLDGLGFAACWPDFFLFKKSDPTNPQPINSFNIFSSKFDYFKRTVFLIHGFTDNSRETHLNQAKDELLKTMDLNVIMVDWAEGAEAPDYFQAHLNTKLVGERTAKFIYEARFNTALVHCVGHSLGAHACGYTGRNVKLNRISGLDPAGPLFGESNRLRMTDADYVDVIHTDALAGLQERIGHKDFYPNGGLFQNGCKGFIGKRSVVEKQQPAIEVALLEQQQQRRLGDPRFFGFNPLKILGCSHSRSVAYFAESINSKCRFSAAPCYSYDDFKLSKCRCGGIFYQACAFMGYYSNVTTLNGIFYLDTNKAEPFCMN